MSIRSSYGFNRYSAVPLEDDVVVSNHKSWSGKERPPLIFCHGALNTGVTAFDTNSARPFFKELAQDYCIGMANFGGNLFGNDDSMALVNACLTNLRTNYSASDDPPVMVGFSMGGCVALNYALDNPVTAVAGCLPLTDLTSCWEDNVLNLKTAIDAAYGGTYDPEVDGPDNDPLMFADRLDGIPIRLFISTNDPIVPLSWAQNFIAARPETTGQMIGNYGHGNPALSGCIGRVLPWLRDYDYPIQDPGPVPS